MGLENIVTFLGYISDEEKSMILARSHCLVMPSMREGWATPVIEAGFLGTMSIGSNVIGISETIVEGKTGFLVPYGDAEALARCITKILEDPKLCLEMGELARQNSKEYDINLTKAKFASAVDSY